MCPCAETNAEKPYKRIKVSRTVLADLQLSNMIDMHFLNVPAASNSEIWCVNCLSCVVWYLHASTIIHTLFGRQMMYSYKPICIWSHLPFIYRRTLANFGESPMVSIWHGFHFHIVFSWRLSFCMVWGKPNNVHDHCLSALINQNFEQISHGLAWHGTKLGALPTFSYIPRHCLVSLHCTIPSLEILKYKVHTVMYNKVFSRSADGVHVL